MDAATASELKMKPRFVVHCLAFHAAEHGIAAGMTLSDLSQNVEMSEKTALQHAMTAASAGFARIANGMVYAVDRKAARLP